MEAINRIIKVINGQCIPIKTPSYLFDELIIENNYNFLKSLLSNANCKFSIAYSIKTNPLGIILSKLKACGGWADTTSKLEIQLAERFEFPEIIFNGIYKTYEEMAYAAQAGCTIILDGMQQISIIQKIAAENKGPIKVGIRISSFPILDDDGIRFGIFVNDAELIKIAKNLTSIKMLIFVVCICIWEQILRLQNYINFH